MSLTVPFCGEEFQLSDSIGLMPLLKFAKVTKSGLDSSDLEGMVAIYDMLEQCFVPEEWDRFQDVATKKRASAEALLAVIRKAGEVISSHPTGQPSDSSDGPQTTSTSSAAGFAEAESLEPGRPDMAMGILRMVS